MTAERRIAFVVAVLCLVSLPVWLYYWLFVASRDSGLGPTVTIVNHPDGSQSFPVTYAYDSAQRFGPYIPLVILGVYGSVVGSIIGGIVVLVNRRTAHGNLPIVAVPLAAAVGLFSAVASLVGIAVVGLAFCNPTSIGGVLFVLPGVCIFTGLPAILGSVGTSCLLYGFIARPRLPAENFTSDAEM